MCGELASWFCPVLKIKTSAPLFFGGGGGWGGGQREAPLFPQRGFPGEVRVIGPEPRCRAPSVHTLGPSSGSDLHVQGRRSCISVVSTVRGWLRPGGPPRAWLHGLGAGRQLEESGRGHELAYVSLLGDARLLQAGVGQRRHVAQRAEARLGEGAGVHGQADGDQPIRHGRHASRGEGLPADLCEPAAGDLGEGRKRVLEKTPQGPQEGYFLRA